MAGEVLRAFDAVTLRMHPVLIGEEVAFRPPKYDNMVDRLK
jgi:hypothetical protein